jgi:hypothetical protein
VRIAPKMIKTWSLVSFARSPPFGNAGGTSPCETPDSCNTLQKPRWFILRLHFLEAVAGKTVTRKISDDQAAHYQAWFHKRRLPPTVSDLENPLSPSIRPKPTETANADHTHGENPASVRRRVAIYPDRSWPVWTRGLAGVVLCLVGAVWVAQGTGALHGSGMSGHGRYAGLGVVVILVGLALLAWANRIRRSRTRSTA